SSVRFSSTSSATPQSVAPTRATAGVSALLDEKQPPAHHDIENQRLGFFVGFRTHGCCNMWKPEAHCLKGISVHAMSAANELSRCHKIPTRTLVYLSTLHLV